MRKELSLRLIWVVLLIVWFFVLLPTVVEASKALAVISLLITGVIVARSIPIFVKSGI